MTTSLAIAAVFLNPSPTIVPADWPIIDLPAGLRPNSEDGPSLILTAMNSLLRSTQLAG